MQENNSAVALQPLPRVSQDAHASADNNRDGDDASRHSSLTAVHSVKTPDPPAPSYSFKLHYSFYGLFLAIIYAILALFPWIVICILSYRPVTTQSYTKTFKYYKDAEDVHALFARNERWFHAARVIQSIATILTLPLTSGVCATAAVIFMQRSRNLTMRQVMALADRDWMPFAGNIRLVFSDVKYRSRFLFIAAGLSILGLIIAPLQAILLTTDTIKSPTGIHTMNYLLDLTGSDDLYLTSSSRDDLGDRNLVTIMTRTALKTATLDEEQDQLWQGPGMSGDSESDTHPWGPSDYWCSSSGATLCNIDPVSDRFLAQLPSDFNTGLIRQYLPRINSTARYENITAEEFPRDCQSTENGYFVEYANTTAGYDDNVDTWGIQVCMPGDIAQSPWKATRDRQDFSEVLYLNITIDGNGYDYDRRIGNRFYRLTLNTTAGYFELPNYMNGGLAGPLLEEDPSALCKGDCEPQGYKGGAIGYSNLNSYDRRDSQLSEPSIEADAITTKGPLLIIALALFGEGSFIATRARHPAAYAATTVLSNDPTYEERNMADICYDTVPLGRLMDSYQSYGINRCISHLDGGTEGWGVPEQIVEWLENFTLNEQATQIAFTAAAFLANKAWIQYNEDSVSDRSLDVSYDRGADTRVPVISLPAIIVISFLLGIQVFSLLALGIYARWSPRWTSTLDSFAMMRMGADSLPQLPMLLASGSHRVYVFDQAPGYMGDAAEGEAVGRLGVGASAQLRGNKRYLSSHRDPDVYVNNWPGST